MICAYCGSETKVTNSRLQKRSNQVWRRRQCLKCQAVFTTLELIDFPTAFMVGSEPFLPDKLYTDVLNALKGRKDRYIAARELTNTVIKHMLKLPGRLNFDSKEVSQETAKVLKRFDGQAYLRFVAEHPSLQ